MKRLTKDGLRAVIENATSEPEFELGSTTNQDLRDAVTEAVWEYITPPRR